MAADKDQLTNEKERQVSDKELASTDKNHLFANAYFPLVLHGCDDKWSLSKQDRSQEVYLSNNYRTAHFHPNWSKGTAGIRGTRILNNGVYYWELKVSQRVFGTR